jgi:carboxypeptidase Q
MPVQPAAILLAAALTIASFPVPAQEVDLSVVHQIKTEAFHNSKVMDHLAKLSDLYGPRLTASPEWK